MITETIFAWPGMGRLAVDAESPLSFLGQGVQPPEPTWGNMLTDSQNYMWRAPMLAVYPGVLIFAVVLAYNFLGDGLRDALDPQMQTDEDRG